MLLLDHGLNQLLLVLHHQGLLLIGQVLLVLHVSQLLIHDCLVLFICSLFIGALSQLLELSTLCGLLPFGRCCLLLLQHHELLLLLEQGLELLFVELVEELLAKDWHLDQVAVGHVALQDLVLQVELD